MKKYCSFFIICLLISSCRGGELANRENLETALNSGDFSTYIQSGGYRPGSFSEDYKGSDFLLSFHFAREGLDDEQVRFLEEEIESGFFREEAAAKLYSLLGEEDQWNRLSRLLKGSYREEDEATSYHDLLLESLYRSGRTADMEKLRAGEPTTLFELLGALTENREEAASLISPYVYRRADFSEIDLLYNYLLDKGLFYSLENNLKYYILAVSAFNKGDKENLENFLARWELPSEAAESFPSLLYRLRLPAQQAGLARHWAERLGYLHSFSALFTAARLYTFEKDYQRAEELFLEAHKRADSGYERDRSMWYRMNLFKSNPSRLTGLIEDYAPYWNDPLYFNDILEEYISVTAAAGRWDLMERIYPLIEKYGDSESVAAFSWVRLLSPPGQTLSHDQKTLLVEKMIQAPHMSFHSIMGNVLIGNGLEFDNSEIPEERETISNQLIEGFLDFYLFEEALEYSRGLEDQLSRKTLRSLWQLAMERDDPLRAIQFSAYLSPREGLAYDQEDLKLRYPRLYQEDIKRFSDENRIPEEVMTGIIRTESAFSHDIVSYAGAVGLSQLMPETAAEQARKLGIESPDLTDPQTNIEIGSTYVRWILNRPWNDNLSQMLMAYNAGGGNLRKWKRQYPRYSDELFAEAIPYKETRNYVKKVVTSSVVYGSIYGTETPEQIIGKIFPEIDTLKLNN